jgi:carbonic anhydrase/acetyltransferase-like protein (isoleucine patch superfamily)/bifunctional DNA-binding transcriptional regulator/antitoxin component of YhaV-PrlF toxin-antitoxin module
MADVTIDSEGRLPLPPEVREALGWKPGLEIYLRVEGDQLLAQPASPSTSLKEEARQLAEAMHGLTLETAPRLVDAEAHSTAASAGPPSSPAGTGQPASSAIEAFQGVLPRAPVSAFLSPGASLIGDVLLGEDVSIWPGVVLRGDVAPIRIGARTNIQDGAVVHVSPHLGCTIGSGVTVGHQATVHACTVGDSTLIGIHAVVLDGAKVGRHCLIAAGCVVPPGMEIPDGKMVMGVPAKVVRDLTPQEIERVHWHADSYVSLKNQYQQPTVSLPPQPAARAPKPAPPTPGTLPRYECRRTAGQIRVDGSLDDPGWTGIPPMSPLVHSNGAGAPREQTEVKVSWDDANLYLAYACKDADIWGNFEHRDDPLYDEEVVEFFLCPTGDLRHYFEFEISPLNVLFDAKVFSPEGDRRSMLVDREWNAAGIRTAVRVSGTLNDRTAPDIGWIAEAALPFADLGLSGPPAPGTVWRANFYRIERGETTEFTAWSPTYKEPADFHVSACFGELIFVGE